MLVPVAVHNHDLLGNEDCAKAHPNADTGTVFEIVFHRGVELTGPLATTDS